jgi:hypothetical protein
MGELWHEYLWGAIRGAFSLSTTVKHIKNKANKTLKRWIVIFRWEDSLVERCHFCLN